jgi:4-amino-4-deoxy-L-arabinose transferase-like glycosyltransferase
MVIATSAASRHTLSDEAAEWLRDRPACVLALVLALHVVVWTMLPLLSSHNLQLDLVEDLALGKEWQIGYWKHPPLPWWLAAAVYRLFGDERAVYVLGPLSTAICMWAAWRLGCMVLSAQWALIAALSLEGMHFYNYSAVMFAHDQCQLPFWALAGWFLYRAITLRKALDWVLSGFFLALAFWSKYACLLLIGTILLMFLFDPTARTSLRSRGPYLMAVSFAVVTAPQAWWLVRSGFQPFQYIDQRAIMATHWSHYLVFPVRWMASQVGLLAPTLALLAIMIWPPALRSQLQGDAGFPRRYLTLLALGPFVLMTLAAFVSRRSLHAMWGYPLWTFAPLALLLWFAPRLEPAPARLRWFMLAFLGVFTFYPVAYAATIFAEPLVRDRLQAQQFGGRFLAKAVTDAFRQRTHGALAYVTGTEFVANNVAVYSDDRPHVIVHWDFSLSPWIDRDDAGQRGMALVLDPTLMSNESWEQVKRRFPTAEFQSPLFIPRSTLVARPPVRIEWAIVPPLP